MSSYRLPKRYPYRAIIGIVSGVLVMMAGSTHGAEEPASVWGGMAIDTTDAARVEHLFAEPVVAPEFSSLPAELTASPWDLPTFNDNHGVWLYANAEGRVRATARTGTSNEPGARYANASLVWTGIFTRDTPDAPSFTIIPSWLEVMAEDPILVELRNKQGVSSLPYAKLRISVRVVTEDLLALKFYHQAELSGLANPINPALDIKLRNVQHINHFGPAVYGNLEPEPIFYEACFPLPQYPTCVRRKIGMRYELPELTQEVDLDFFVEMGETYRIEYQLEVEVGEDGYETYAGAVLGDPLDVSQGGLSLSTNHTLVSSSVSTCRETPDPIRYTAHADGTVTDTRTGLMWQRCPVGYSLDDNGTPADPADDGCELNGTAELHWEGALQAADAADAGGHDDWYLPNVKELESLVEPSCSLPATDETAFPSTPPQPFWTSTPDSESGNGWQVSFLNGELASGDMTGSALVRLARDSGDPALAPPAALSARSAQVLEGDSGVSDLLVPIVLDRPTATAVTVDYVSEPVSASDDDFTAAAGSLTIPAGQTRAEVIIAVHGDTAAEGDEWLTLRLENPSANAYLTTAAVQATILDDEPVVSVAPSLPEQTEGDVGATTYAFTVSLDKPAVAGVSVDYSTRDASAVEGSDYQETNGTVSFAAGETASEVSVVVLADDIRENDETFVLELSNPGGGATLGEREAEAVLVDDDGRLSYRAINDTGVTYCATATDTVLACPQTGFPRQDGEVGRDITHPDPGDGVNGFSFTKLDDTGAELADQAASYGTDPWACVLDEVTGLYWEVKTDDATDLRHWDWSYSWFDSSGVDDGGDPGVENGGACFDGSNCDTEKYIAAVNAMNLCGFDDWRLPGIDELFTLARTASPEIEAPYGLESNYFPHNYNQPGSFINGYTYWSGTPSAASPPWAWALRLRVPDPAMTEGHKGDATRVRLVRGGE